MHAAPRACNALLLRFKCESVLFFDRPLLVFTKQKQRLTQSLKLPMRGKRPERVRTPPLNTMFWYPNIFEHVHFWYGNLMFAVALRTS